MLQKELERRMKFLQSTAFDIGSHEVLIADDVVNSGGSVSRDAMK